MNFYKLSYIKAQMGIYFSLIFMIYNDNGFISEKILSVVVEI